jgi:magnesium and cobalt transporter
MLDDVLDQVVGEIHDEFDEEEVPGIEFVDERSFLVEGGYPLHELEDHVDQLDLENRDVSTVGGFLTSIAGRIPEPGEIIELDGYRATILEADERSIRQVQFLRVERQTANSESTEAIKGGTPSETDKD